MARSTQHDPYAYIDHDRRQAVVHLEVVVDIAGEALDPDDYTTGVLAACNELTGDVIRHAGPRRTDALGIVRAIRRPGADR